MTGWTDPKTKRATAFYALLGILCSNIWHTGWNQFNFWAFVMMTGLGTVSSVVKMMSGKDSGETPTPHE